MWYMYVPMGITAATNIARVKMICNMTLLFLLVFSFSSCLERLLQLLRMYQRIQKIHKQRDYKHT